MKKTTGSSHIITLLILIAASGAAPGFGQGPYVEMTGACRGTGWNQNGWPKGQGYLTIEQCRERCETTQGCTSFDYARPSGGKYDCYLFGHRQVVGMGTTEIGTCHTKAPAYQRLVGACRGAGWNQNGWPKAQGYQTPADCQARCEGTQGCTSYDYARPSGGKYDCYLFGHTDVVGEGPVEIGTCFTKAAK